MPRRPWDVARARTLKWHARLMARAWRSTQRFSGVGFRQKHARVFNQPVFKMAKLSTSAVTDESKPTPDDAAPVLAKKAAKKASKKSAHVETSIPEPIEKPTELPTKPTPKTRRDTSLGTPCEKCGKPCEVCGKRKQRERLYAKRARLAAKEDGPSAEA